MPYADPARKRANDAAYYQKNRETCRKAHKEYQAANRESINAWQRRYREANGEKLRAWHRDYQNKYREENKEWIRRQRRVLENTRRARKLNQFVEEVDPTTVYEMHGGRCGICEEFIEDDFHVDHVIPLSKGGMHGYINVQPAHPVCNMRKGARYEPRPR